MLEVGQVVYLQSTDMFFRDPRKQDSLNKMIVHKANKTSAYIWYAEDEIDETHRTFFKVNQKDLSVKYPIPNGYIYKLWFSREAYLEHLEAARVRAEYTKRATELIKKMSIDKLKEFVEKEESTC